MPESLHKNLGVRLTEIYRTARMAVDRGFHTPALILVYSGIDIVGWFDSTDPEEGSRESFTNWAETYMEPEDRLGCTAEDLYGARCGLLHRGGPDSDMAERGDCQRIFYSYGWRHEDDLRTAIEALEEDAVSVHLDSLLEVFRRGLAEYVRTVRSYDPERKAEVKEKAVRAFTNMGPEGLARVDALMEHLESSDE